MGGHDWQPIGNYVSSYGAFRGNYNGNGYSINNMYINTPDAERSGLFGQPGSGTIENVTLRSSTVIGGGCTGALVGTADNDLYIKNCIVEANVTGTKNVGGIAGWHFSKKISNCTFSGSVTGSDTVGGISGAAEYVTYSNCKVYGSVSSSGNTAGGIAGLAILYSGRTMTGCVNYAQVYAGGNYAGGLVGYNDNNSMVIDHCINNGNVKAGGNVAGGIVGYCQGEVKNSIAKCTVEVTVGGHTGGLVGMSEGEYFVLENCVAYTQVINTPGTPVGGMVGTFSGQIKNCSFIGGSNFNISAFVGRKGENATIESSFSFINNSGYYSSGSFEGFGVINNFNSGLPAQKSLFYVANASPSFSTSWFTEHGFSLLTN